MALLTEQTVASEVRLSVQLIGNLITFSNGQFIRAQRGETALRSMSKLAQLDFSTLLIKASYCRALYMIELSISIG